MTVGSPDYGVTSGQVNETSNSDVLELASRLGAIASVNRTGQQIISVCEGILYNRAFWYSSTANGIFQPSLLYPVFNRPNLKVITGGALSETAGILFNHLPFGSMQIGQAAYLLAGSFTCKVSIQLDLVISGQDYRAGVLVDISNGNAYVVNQVGGLDSIGTYAVPSSTGEPMVIKYTVDFNSMKYGDIYYGSETRTDLSSHIPYKTALAMPDMSLIQVLVQNNAAASNNLYIADCIITINEAM